MTEGFVVCLLAAFLVIQLTAVATLATWARSDP